MINIEEITWENFLGYGDYTSKLNFGDYKGICLIEGEHDGNESREDGDEKLNGSGKSTIIEAITWGLFGNLTKSINPGDKVVNWFTGKNCKVRIKTKDGYEIIRLRNYNGMTETLLFKDGDDITRSTSKPIQQFINETFSIDYNIFIRSRIFSQSSVGFMQLSESKMRSVLEKMMYVDNISPIATTAKYKVDGLNKDIDLLSSNIETIDNEITSISDRIENLKTKSIDFDDQKETKKSEIKLELNSLKDETITKINSINELIKSKSLEKQSKKSININELKIIWDEYNKEESNNLQINEKIDSYNNKINDLKSDKMSKLSELSSLKLSNKSYVDINQLTKDHADQNSVKEKLSKAKSIKDELIADIAKIESKIDDLKDELNKIKSLGVGKCSKCNNDITEEHLEYEINKIKASIDKLTKSLKTKNKSIDLVKSKIKELESQVKDLISISDAENNNKTIDEELKRQKTINDQISEIDNNIEKLNILIKEESLKIKEITKPDISVSEAETINKYIENISKEIDKSNSRILEIKEEFKIAVLKGNARINDINNEVNPYDKLISEERTKLLDKKTNKEELVKSLNEKKTLRLHVDYIRESYQNKKKIKAFWISELIPDFNRYLEYYLDFFEVNDRIKFDEYLMPKMDRWSYLTHSGGECMRIELCLMFALNDLHVLNFGAQSNFMALDEVDGKLDPFAINKIVSLLSDDISKRNDGLTNIFVISHRKEMKDRFPHKIRVKNKQERAYINE